MDFFCLIYPDAVFHSRALKVVALLQRSGIQIPQRSCRCLTFEEAKTIFYSRRYNDDYEKFCHAQTISPCWMLQLNIDDDQDLEFLLSEYVPEKFHSDFFIPEEEEDHQLFLRLITDDPHRSEGLSQIVSDLRQRLSLQEDNSDLQWSAIALLHGNRMFAYYAAMQIAGFSEAQAFELTSSAHQVLLDSIDGDWRTLHEQEGDDEDLDEDEDLDDDD